MAIDGTIQAKVDEAITQWETALIDGKVTLVEFVRGLIATLAALYVLVSKVAGSDADYKELRDYVEKQIDERITPIDLPNIGPFFERTVADPAVKSVVLGGLDAFRAKLVLVG